MPSTPSTPPTDPATANTAPTGKSDAAASRGRRSSGPDRTGSYDVEFTGLDRDGKLVFAGLMLGMFVASVSQTIVGPAMPRIVADLGGLDYYNWVITAAMLVSAVVVPIAGKLSDMYGRKGLYLAGLGIFMTGTILAGLSGGFWFLVFARAVQGLGMGILMPLSQTIIGDIIPPRQRGKYQGLMGTVFAVSSVAGPLVGGTVTDNFGWRSLFFLTLPLGILAFAFIVRFMRLDFTAQPARIDVWGMATLTPALVLGLLATTWAGSTYAWTSPVILGMFAASIVLLVAFVLIELKVESPLVPLSMLRDPVVALSIAASFLISVAMFGAIVYIPVYAQGAMGVSATDSGAILIPHTLSMMLVGIVIGLLVSRFGRYKAFMLTGGLLLVVGYGALAMVRFDDTPWHLVIPMLVTGIGLGMTVQLYTLAVQNAVPQSELGIATASLQFARNLGSTVGTAVLGALMSASMAGSIASHLPDGADAAAADLDASSVLDPSALADLPPAVADAIREGLADAISTVFIAIVPVAALALLLTVFIAERPLRTTLQKREPRTTTGSVPAIGAEDGWDENERQELDAVRSSAPTGTDASEPTRDTETAGSRQA